MSNTPRVPDDRSPIIRAPEDTITQMARRAYGKFREFEMKMGDPMRPWDEQPITVHVVWKGIIAEALGTRGTMVNVNPLLRDPHTLLITGLSDERALALRQGIEAKLGGTAEAPAMKYSDRAFHSPTEGDTDDEQTN